MTFEDLRDRIAADGIQSVLKHETKENWRRGGIAGFELLRTLNSMPEIEACLAERQNVEHMMRNANEPAESYWEYRMATAQIEWALEVFRVGAGSPTGMISARAAMKYAEIVGVEGA